MLGIIVALESETKNLENVFENKGKKVVINGFSGYLFEILEQNVVLIYSGVGKANAASAVISLINNFSVDHIVNIGSAGSVSKNILPNSLFIPESLQYVDVDVTGFGYKPNQLPKLPEQFLASKKISSILLEISNDYSLCNNTGLIGTSDSFINQKNYKLYNLQNVNVVDMESCAIAQICYLNKIECGFIKYISDSIFHDANSEQQWNNNINNNNLISELIYNISYKYVYNFQLKK